MVICGVSALAGLFVFWILLWVQLFACFPSEQVYLTSVSPDGGKAARFSVKYEGLCRWLPYDIEPQYYVTVTDTAHGRIMLRKNGYHGDLKSSFSELAKQHAPWTVAELTATLK